MAAISELCAALEACLPFFHSPPDSGAARTRGERLQRRLAAAVQAIKPSDWDDEARASFYRLLGELGGAMAAVARSPASQAAFTFERGSEGSPAHVLATCQLNTAHTVIIGCASLEVIHTILGGSDAFRWAQSWRLLAELGRRSVQSGLAGASQTSRALHASPAAALLVGEGTQIPLQTVLYRTLDLLEAAGALLRMLRLPGSERTLAAFAGTTAASADTPLFLAITSTALTVCLQQGVGPAAEPMRFFHWAAVCGSLLADPPFARVQALMQAQPHIQAAIAGLLLHALPVSWLGIKAAADAGGEGLLKAAHFASCLLRIAAAPCLHAGLQQALGQCTGSSGEAALEALVHVVEFAAQGSSSGTAPADVKHSAEAVCAWGQLCAALAAHGPGSPLQRHASRNSVMVLPALVELASAALQELPAGSGQVDADATAAAAAERVLSSLAAAAKFAAGHDALDQQARPLRSDSMANAATAALKLLHLAAERQAVAPSAGGGSGALPGLSALAEAGAAAAVSCLGIGMADMMYRAEVQQGAATEQVVPDVAKRLWLVHTTACRLLHYVLGRPAELPRVLPDRYETGWEGFLAAISGLVFDLTVRLGECRACYTQADEGEERTDMHHSCPMDARTMEAIAVAHAEAMTAVLAAMESGSSNVPCEGHPAEALLWGVAEGVTRAAVLVEASVPGCPNVVLGSAAAMDTLCSALEKALRMADQPGAAADQAEGRRAAGEGTGREIWVAKGMATMSCVRAAAACPQLAATLIVRGLLGPLMEADLTPDKRGGTLTFCTADVNTVRAIVMGMIKDMPITMVRTATSCQAAAGGSTQADAAAGGMHSAARTTSAQAEVPAAALAAALAAMPELPVLDLTTRRTVAVIIQSKAAELTYFCDTVLPTIQPLGQALDAFDRQPEQQAAAQLAMAQAAAARSCAYLRCPNVGATGGPAAGQQPGSKRCGGCRVVRYCNAACSTADWRAGHRRVCKQLAAARLQEQPAAGGEAPGDVE